MPHTKAARAAAAAALDQAAAVDLAASEATLGEYGAARLIELVAHGEAQAEARALPPRPPPARHPARHTRHPARQPARTVRRPPPPPVALAYVCYAGTRYAYPIRMLHQARGVWASIGPYYGNEVRLALRVPAQTPVYVVRVARRECIS